MDSCSKGRAPGMRSMNQPTLRVLLSSIGRRHSEWVAGGREAIRRGGGLALRPLAGVVADPPVNVAVIELVEADAEVTGCVGSVFSLEAERPVGVEPLSVEWVE